jgi:GNAT superfamily N-acetyltransferase
LNSINPLDPNDHAELGDRIERATTRFSSVGKPLTFRQTPLASRELDSWLNDRKFRTVHESTVMAADLDMMSFNHVMDMLPMRDERRYVAASAAIHGLDANDARGLESVIRTIEPAKGLFVQEDAAGPVASVICVQDGALAGILDLATRPDARGLGHGRSVMLAALKWARAHGAVTAWLQMDLGSREAALLYAATGFRELYRYAYRVAPEAE